MRTVAVLASLALLGGCSAPSTGGDGGAPSATAATTPTLPPLHPSVDGYDEALATFDAGDGHVLVAVKVARTPEQRRHGLMEVPTLPPGTGMAFVYDAATTGPFWMKDTLIPLDIAFVAEGRITTILTMQPCTTDPCPLHSPGAAYDLAIEVPAGWYADAGIAVGDTVEVGAPNHRVSGPRRR